MNHTRSEIFNVKIQVRDKSRGQVWKIAPNFSTHQLLRGPCKITLWSYFPNFSLKTMKPFSVYNIQNTLNLLIIINQWLEMVKTSIWVKVL